MKQLEQHEKSIGGATSRLVTAFYRAHMHFVALPEVVEGGYSMYQLLLAEHLSEALEAVAIRAAPPLHLDVVDFLLELMRDATDYYIEESIEGALAAWWKSNNLPLDDFCASYGSPSDDPGDIAAPLEGLLLSLVALHSLIKEQLGLASLEEAQKKGDWDEYYDRFEDTVRRGFETACDGDEALEEDEMDVYDEDVLFLVGMLGDGFEELQRVYQYMTWEETPFSLSGTPCPLDGI